MNSDQKKNKRPDSGSEKKHNTNVRHPGSLPAHLDEALFAEFLSLQDDVLDEMEVLVLGIEDGSDAKQLSVLRRLFHTLKGEAGFLNLVDVEIVCHTTEDVFDNDDPVAFTDILLAVVDWLRAAMAGYSGKGGMPGPAGPVVAMIEDRRAAAGKEAGDVEKDRATGRKADSRSENTGLPSEAIAGAGGRGLTKIKEFVNVDAIRLDKIVNTIGELVIAESMIRQSDEVSEFASAALVRDLGHLGKITRELQEISLTLRMVPVKGIFRKMVRVVRDVAKKSCKDVQLVLSGEETELDKHVVDRIGDPLMHIVRNAVDHGIESSVEERAQAGKSETAAVTLRAFHKGGNIYIEVEDDGRGIDTGAVFEKAVQNGIVDKDAVLSEEEIMDLIFLPGFSTAETVTGVSGRGIGMDIVKTNIESLRGKVSIKSKKGKGCVFSISIPLTLAIIDGIIVRVAGECYIIPTASIVTSRKFDNADIKSVQQKGEMVSIQGRLIPMFRLDLLFDVRRAEDGYDNAVIIIVEDNGQRTGLLVDDILGKQQIVIKSLGETMKNISGIAGGAIMSDGKVGLILDIGGIVKRVNEDGYYLNG